MKNLLLIIFCICLDLSAHQLRENYLQVQYNQTINSLYINLEVETRLLELNSFLDDNKNEIISFKELRMHKDYLYAYVKKHFKLSYKNKNLSMSDANIVFHRYQDQTYMQINKSFSNIGINGLVLKYDMFFELEDIHKLLIHQDLNNIDLVLDKNNRTYSFSSREISQWQRLYIFFKEGVTHILDGLDHLLFVLMLLISSVAFFANSLIFENLKKSFYSLLKVITTFSIAHSLTLFISGIGLWTPNIMFIESSIALSIFIVGILNFFAKYNHVNYKIVFLFGLLHGFGFANVLEIAQINNSLSFLVSLFGFNLGVEVGQIAVIFLVLPFLYLLSRWIYYYILVKIISFGAMGIAMFWFFQRIGYL